jgi:hypothetical protein
VRHYLLIALKPIARPALAASALPVEKPRVAGRLELRGLFADADVEAAIHAALRLACLFGSSAHRGSAGLLSLVNARMTLKSRRRLAVHEPAGMIVTFITSSPSARDHRVTGFVIGDDCL